MIELSITGWHAVGADQVAHRGANLVHRAPADPRAEQRLRSVVAVPLVQRDRRLELGELLAEELVQSPETVALFGRPVGDEHFAQAVEGVADLGQRGLIGLQILFVAAVVTAGSGFTVTVIVYGAPVQEPVVDTGVTIY